MPTPPDQSQPAPCRRIETRRWSPAPALPPARSPGLPSVTATGSALKAEGARSHSISKPGCFNCSHRDRSQGTMGRSTAILFSSQGNSTSIVIWYVIQEKNWRATTYRHEDRELNTEFPESTVCSTCCPFHPSILFVLHSYLYCTHTCTALLLVLTLIYTALLFVLHLYNTPFQFVLNIGKKGPHTPSRTGKPPSVPVGIGGL